MEGIQALTVLSSRTHLTTLPKFYNQYCCKCYDDNIHYNSPENKTSKCLSKNNIQYQLHIPLICYLCGITVSVNYQNLYERYNTLEEHPYIFHCLLMLSPMKYCDISSPHVMSPLNYPFLSICNHG